jgi:hypothetical protein
LELRALSIVLTFKPISQGKIDRLNLTCLQQKQRYQALEVLPMCENNRNRRNLALIPVPVVPWAYPNSIGKIVELSDSWTSLNTSKKRPKPKYGISITGLEIQSQLMLSQDFFLPDC